MFNEVKKTIRQVIRRMLGKSAIESKLDIEIAITEQQLNDINKWLSIYQNKAPWLRDTVISTNLASSVCSEIARLVTLELETEISGNDYLQEQYEPVVKKLRRYCELGCAGGSLAFKPYLSGDKIAVDVVQADRFYPVAYDSNDKVTSGVFVQKKIVGRDLYIRFEEHELIDTTYTIKNTAYLYKRHLDTNANLDLQGGQKILLTDVDEWADLDPVSTIENVDRPLFGYFKVPAVNNEDTDSPAGAAVFSRAVKDIEIADEQWSRIWWEYEGTELAVHASDEAFRMGEDGNPDIPEKFERLYRAFSYNTINDKAMEAFSPAIRDESLFNGFNNVLKQVEYKCSMAYGTLSDPQNVDKTAEEIKASKQRSYQSVSDIQSVMQTTLEDLVYAMSVIAQLYELTSNGNYEISFNWDDSIIVDKETEYSDMREDVSAGLLRPELYVMKRYGVTEEKAREMMPKKEAPDKPPANQYGIE